MTSLTDRLKDDAMAMTMVLMPDAGTRTDAHLAAICGEAGTPDTPVYVPTHYPLGDVCDRAMADVTMRDVRLACDAADIYPALGEPVQAARALSAGLPYSGRSFSASLVDGRVIVAAVAS